MHYLLSATETPPAGQWISEKDIPGGTTFFRGPHEVPTHLIASRFDGDIQGFTRLCEQYGGTNWTWRMLRFHFSSPLRCPWPCCSGREIRSFPQKRNCCMTQPLSATWPRISSTPWPWGCVNSWDDDDVVLSVLQPPEPFPGKPAFRPVGPDRTPGFFVILGSFLWLVAPFSPEPHGSYRRSGHRRGFHRFPGSARFRSFPLKGFSDTPVPRICLIVPDKRCQPDVGLLIPPGRKKGSVTCFSIWAKCLHPRPGWKNNLFFPLVTDDRLSQENIRGLPKIG